MARIYSFRPKKKRRVFGSLSVTMIIILINIMAFILFSILIKLNIPLDYVAIKPSNILQGKYLWTFITSMFMHGSFFHIFANMFSLFFIGTLIEKILGVKRYFYFYMLSGLLVLLTPNLPVFIMFIPIPIKMKYAGPGILVVLWLISIAGNVPIGNTAHFGGLIVGIAYGLYLKTKYKKKTKKISRMFS